MGCKDTNNFSLFTFHFPLFFVTLTRLELTMHSEMKRKTSFPFAFLSFFRNFAPNINYSRFYDESKEPKYDDCNSMLYDDEHGV